MSTVEVLARLRDPARLAQLTVRRILDTPRDESFDRLTRLAAHSLDVPVVLLTLVDAERQFFKSTYGLRDPWASRRQTPLSHSFCQYVVAEGKAVRIDDAGQDPRVQENLAIPEMGVRAYLGVPLMDEGGVVLGSFAAIDERPRKWTDEDLELLVDFAALAMKEIVLRGESAQRQEAESRLIQRQKMEAVGALAGGVAHDFNNLLTAIGGSSEILLDSLEEPDPVREEVLVIRDAVRRACELTSQLLAVSRQQPLRLEELALDRMVAEIETILRRLLPDTIVLGLDLAEDTPPVRADRGLVEHALLNLVTNARDAMPDGGRLRIGSSSVSIGGKKSQDRIALSETLPAGEYACLSVSDTGIGIEPSVLEHIFEPFFTTKERGSGTGLGLALIDGTIRQLGGQVTVQSEPGAGSTFRIYLPVTSSGRASEARESGSASDPAA